VIEAVEAPYDTAWDAEQHPETQRPQFFLGVQWHPERSYDISQTSRNLFTRLVAEASKLQTDDK
jgi:putative glutamine amidotransferase